MALNPYEFMHGMHVWRRQVQIHWAYYQWWFRVLSSHGGSLKDLAKTLSGLRVSVSAVTPGKPAMLVLDLVKHAILTDVRLKGSAEAPVGTSTVRCCIRSRGGLRTEKRLAALVRECVTDLAARG